MTPPVLAGSVLALLLTLVAMALGFGRPAKKAARKSKAPAKPVASPKPAKAPAAAKSTPAKTIKAPATPGTDVRRSARCVQI